MMGRLTERDREQIAKAVRGVAANDIGMIQDAVMILGEFKEPPDPSRLYEDINNLYPNMEEWIWGILMSLPSLWISWMS